MHDQTFFIDPHAQNSVNTRKSYNLVNEYLENPNKHFDYYLDNQIRGSGKSITKKEKVINYPAKAFIKASVTQMSKKRIANKRISAKKMNFKSFDQRRALTKIDHREHSLEDPPNYSYSNPLRSSSVCHKKSMSNDRLSGARPKTTKTGIRKSKPIVGKSSSHRGKKGKQKANMTSLQKASVAQAMMTLAKAVKNSR